MTHQTLTPDLFQDIIDHDLTAVDICIKHDLSIDELAQIVQSPEFTHAARQLAAIENIRTAATAPLRQRLALRTLQKIAELEPQSPTHAETVRKSAAQLARLTPTETEPDATSAPGRDAHADEPQHDTPPKPDQPEPTPRSPQGPPKATQGPNRRDEGAPAPISPADLAQRAGQPPTDPNRRKAG